MSPVTEVAPKFKKITRDEAKNGIFGWLMSRGSFTIDMATKNWMISEEHSNLEGHRDKLEIDRRLQNEVMRKSHELLDVLNV